MDDDFIDQVIAQAFLAQSVYSKAVFDNYEDTAQLHAAAKDNAEMVIAAIKSRVIPYIDELLERKLRSVIDKSDGRVAMTLGNGEFAIVKVEDLSPMKGKE